MLSTPDRSLNVTNRREPTERGRKEKGVDDISALTTGEQRGIFRQSCPPKLQEVTSTCTSFVWRPYPEEVKLVEAAYSPLKKIKKGGVEGGKTWLIFEYWTHLRRGSKHRRAARLFPGKETEPSLPVSATTSHAVAAVFLVDLHDSAAASPPSP